jgi:hypothetical protein
MIGKMKTAKMFNTTMKKIYTMKHQTIQLVCSFLTLFFILGNIDSVTAASFTDSCCVAKTQLVDKYGAKVAIKLPSPQFWAMADYEITHSLYLELNPTLNTISADQFLNSDESMHQQFAENFSISTPTFSDADDNIQAGFTAANGLLINSHSADVTINHLFWQENEQSVCKNEDCMKSFNSKSPSISLPKQSAWMLADDIINTQLYSTTITAQNSL